MGKAPVDPESRFRIITENTADWQFWVREDGSVEYVSAECERISGFSAKAILSGDVRLRDYVHPEDYPMVRGWYREAVAGKSRHNAEFRIRRKDGGLRWGAISYVPAVDGAGHMIGFRGSIRDITDRKVAQEEVRRERDMLDVVVSSIGAGLVMLDRANRIAWYNAVIAARYGPLSGNRGKHCYRQFKQRDDVCDDCPVVRAFAEGRTATSERPGIPLPNGETRDFVNVATPIAGANGASDHCLELILDVTEARAQQTERERLRRQLIHVQKMEAVGTLAGGVAHEFNNLLTGILGFTSLLQTQCAPDSPHLGSLAMIEKSARRAAELTAQLLGFARKNKFRLQEVRVNEVVRSVASIIRHTFDRAVAIEDDLASDAWAVSGDPAQLEQVLLNLCINARDAMPGGGTLTVRTRNVLDGRDRSSAVRDLVPGPCVCLSVSDTGTGIAPSIRDRIFEPFFTTKDPGKGTGMGLSMVYGIVQSHGGAVDFESGPDGGTTFRVYLPAGAG